MILRSRGGGGRGAAAIAPEFDPASADLEALDAEIERLSAANRTQPDPGRERAILRLRHIAGARLTSQSNRPDDHPQPAFDELVVGDSGVPEVAASNLTSELIRAGIMRHGCLLVRGLVSGDHAARMRDEIDRAFDSRSGAGDGSGPYFEEFVPDPPFTLLERDFVADAGGFWAADSPRLMFSLADGFEQNGLREIATRYLGERPTLSVNKCVLRKVEPDASTAWHQDGAFMGDVRALNVWIALTRCGDVAPGLDLVPRRMERIVAVGTEGAAYDWSVSPALARESAGEAGIVRPIFEPGDALLFDEMFLHNTGVSPEMTDTRYAIETWFFGASGYPGDYVPIAL